MRPTSVIVIAYLLGSIPFGYLIVRAKKGGDIRETGSGGTGATNVSRRAGVSAGVVTLVLDALKGMAAVVVAAWILDVPLVHIFTREPLDILEKSGLTFQQAYWCLWGAAIAVIIGHMFPVWLRFKGGKGVAAFLGVLFAFRPPIAAVLTCLTWLTMAWATRYSSLAALAAAILAPLYFLLLGTTLYALLALVLAILIIYAHRANIARLLRGEEPKIGSA